MVTAEAAHTVAGVSAVGLEDSEAAWEAGSVEAEQVEAGNEKVKRKKRKRKKENEKSRQSVGRLA